MLRFIVLFNDFLFCKMFLNQIKNLWKRNNFFKKKKQIKGYTPSSRYDHPQSFIIFLEVLQIQILNK